MSDQSQTTSQTSHRSAYLKYGITVIVIVAVIIGFYWYIQHKEKYPSTENAYTQAHVEHVAPLVGGQIASVEVDDNAYVDAGDLLFTIQASPYMYQWLESQANLAAARQQLNVIEQNIALDQAKVAEAKAKLELAKQKQKRIKTLYEQQASTAEKLDEVQANTKVAKAELDSATQKINQTNENLAKQKSVVQAQQEQVNQALYNLSQTQVYAKHSGYVTDLNLRPGTYTQKGQNVFNIVYDQDYWLNANYKETALTRVRVGQPASIKLDMYPSVELKGKVESISAASGELFSLLPPQNATGNWVKVTQRFPVRIRIPSDQVKKLPAMRIGASATVTIDTTK